jgi:hypothetical protein
MSKMNVSLSYLRSLASWKPFTTTDGASVLMNVSFTMNDGKLTAVVTDRYRIVMRTDEIGGALVYSVDIHEGLQVPMALIVQFVTATKSAKTGVAIAVDVYFDGDEVTIDGFGSTVRGRFYNGAFPKVVGLVEGWKINENPVNPVGFDVVKVADFAKIISPSNGKKYSTSWKFEQGFSATPDKSGPYRLTNADDVNVVALLQPNIIK